MTRTLDAKTFVALGEGLAAGVGHFSLSEDVQQYSFPALLAHQLKTPFAQPEMQAPGVGNVGFQSLPAIVPDLLQTDVVAGFPRDEADLGNVAVPGATVADALLRRPSAPLVNGDDAGQTLLNLIVGVPALLREGGEAPTQVEYARARKPTLALVALGYQELLSALVPGFGGDAPPDLAGFAKLYDKLVKRLAGRRTTVVLATIPDPLDTAYFSSVETAARILRTEPDFLAARYGLADDDLIALHALVDLGYEFCGRQLSGEIADGGVLGAADATRARRVVAALNDAVRRAAEDHGALLWDLHAFLSGIAADGAEVAGKTLSADYLGGFYLLNGVYPGRTGHALIANDLISCLNRSCRGVIPRVDVAAVMEDDGNTLAELASGGTYTDEFLRPRGVDELPPLPPPDPSLIHFYPPFDPAKLNIFPVQTTYPDPPFDIGGFKAANDCIPKRGFPAGGLSLPKLDRPLELPPTREQTLDIDHRGSYFGDALRAVDEPEERPFLAGLPTFGAGGNTFFGGLAMTDSHLRGKIRLRFAEPDERNISRFELTLPGGLVGDDGTLAAPQLFKMPSQLNRVLDIPGLTSSGELHLDTGLVTDFRLAVIFRNTPTQTLLGVNPALPSAVPLIFPGPPNAGSSWIRFDQRDDGLLDVTLAGNLFLPLGKVLDGAPVRFPLPFATPDLKCASIVARGTSLHPHLHLTTKEEAVPPTDPAEAPELPLNTVREYTPFVHNTSFGDVFGLNIDELGGAGTGRAHLMGRLKVQFGPRSGPSVPVAIRVLPPGGLLSGVPKPLPYLPPGTSRGLVGFNEQLVFPSGETYHQTLLSSAMDPNNLAVGAIDVASGRVLDELLSRAFVVQQLFVNLIRIEPCTPTDSFNYQGPARFQNGPGGEVVFGFDGEVYIPYPKGFRFPSPNPDGEPPFVVVEESRLDPFLRYQAASAGRPSTHVLKSGGDGGWLKDTSSIGQRFSYRFSIPCNPAKADAAEFEYKNHGDDDGKGGKGAFKLQRVSWLRATRTLGSGARPDTVTFGGFGSWTGDDELHQVSVHISTSSEQPYVGIQVDGGTTSNVNTKPTEIEDTIPPVVADD